MALATAANATIINLSAGFTGPFAVQSDTTTRVDTGLTRLGTLTGAPASTSIADIEAVFVEFGTGATTGTGGIGGTYSNGDAGSFNDQQVYFWVFDGADTGSSTEHGLFSVADPDAPASGDNWRYPVHTGSGTDSATLALSAVVQGGDFVVGRTDGSNLVLAPIIPEPSGALLAGLAGALLVFRRRRS